MDEVLLQRDPRTINLNYILSYIDALAELGGYPVHPDAAGPDHVLDGPARGHAGAAENLLEALAWLLVAHAPGESLASMSATASASGMKPTKGGSSSVPLSPIRSRNESLTEKREGEPWAISRPDSTISSR